MEMHFNAMRMRIGLNKFHQLHKLLEFLRLERVAKQFLHVAVAVHHVIDSIYAGLQNQYSEFGIFYVQENRPILSNGQMR